MSHEPIHTKDTQSLPLEFVGKTGRGNASIAVPSAITPKNTLNEIFAFARSQNASDVHIAPRNPIIFRKFSKLIPVSAEKLTADDIKTMLTAGLPAPITQIFEETGDVEYVHIIEGFGRFRTAVMKQRNGYKITARLIPTQIPKFEETGMPPSCAGLTKWAQGIVLITGPAGCGKTTTLATLIEMINQTKHDHIITIEQPIEIVYEPKSAQITQREINLHTLSQNNALRAALREDPDILVVSELRDLQTIQLAISAAETGHLVFGTMNTVNAAQTISRLIDSFPADEQPIIRNMVSESLRGVISQQLIPKKDGSGMAVAYEILIVNPPIANLIREGRIAQMNNAMTTGRAAGMVLLDSSLENLVKNNMITKEEALLRATNPMILKQVLSIA